MKKIVIIALLATMSASAVNYSRDIQPMVDFRKAQEKQNKLIVAFFNNLSEKVNKLNLKVIKLENEKKEGVFGN